MKINHSQLAAFINVNREFYYKLAYSYVHNQEVALHVIHTSITKAFDNFKRLYNPLAIKAWFYQIIVDASIDYLNSKKMFVLVTQEESVLIPRELEGLVRQTVEKAEHIAGQKKLAFITGMSLVVVLIIFTYIYTFIGFSLTL